MNTQSEQISHLKYLTGQTNLQEVDAVRMLNLGLDHYTYLAITSDGNWQFDGSEQSDVPRATTTLSTGEVNLQLPTDLLAIAQVTIINSDGNKNVIRPYDQNKRLYPTPKSTDTGTPSAYDLEGRTIYFNAYANEDYTVEVKYSRKPVRLEVGNSTQVLGIPSIHMEYPTLFAATRVGMGLSDTTLVAYRDSLEKMEKEIRRYFDKRDEDTPKRLRAFNRVIT